MEREEERIKATFFSFFFLKNVLFLYSSQMELGQLFTWSTIEINEVQRQSHEKIEM